MTPSPAAPYMTYFTRYAVPSPCPSRRVRAEEAEYTITAPPARRQNVAVRSSRCSSGCCLDLPIRAGFDRTRRTPPARGPSAADQRLEVVAALLERAVLVVGGAGGREQDRLTGRGGGARGRDRPLEVAAIVERDAGRAQRRAQALRLLPDQVRRRRPFRERRGQRRIVLS